MKFVVDQQLPPVLADWLRRQGFDAVHTRDVHRRDATDIEIWDWARENERIVVSKDEDFVTLHASRGGARLVWIRLGNCDNPTLLARVEAMWPAIVQRLLLGDDFIQLR